MRELGMQHGLIRISAVLALYLLGAYVHAVADEANLVARIAKLERALDNRGLVDLLQQVESLQQEVQQLRGQIEEQTYTIEQLRQTQRDTYADIDQRLRTMGPTGAMLDDEATEPPLTTLSAGDADVVAGTPAPQSSLQVEPGGEAAVEASTDVAVDGDFPPSDATDSAAVSIPAQATVGSIAPRGPTIDNEASEKAYSDAFDLLKAGQYGDSIGAFSEFLQLYPQSQHADNAQYWLGETYYVKREFKPAVAEYRKLIAAYPQSKKRSHAMLKIGYSYHELGKLAQARAVLEDLRNRYPGTTAARLAEERIERVLAETPRD